MKTTPLTLTLLLAAPVWLPAQTGVGRCSGSRDVACVIPNVYNGDDGIRLPRATPGEHEAHFLETSGFTQNFLPLNKAIATQLALLPIVSPASGFTYSFDKSTGVHTRTADSFGPVYSERGETIGARRLFFGFNYQRFDFNKIDGQDLGNMPGLLTHVPTGRALQDVMVTSNNFDLKMNQFTAFATFGVTNRLDVSLAVPIVNVKLNATATARIFRIPSGADDCPGGSANPCHFFDINDKVNSTSKTFTNFGDATGLGDITIRVKHNVVRGERMALAILTDIRTPTGDEKNFLGSGAVGVKPFLAMTVTEGRWSPHFNVGYQWNGKSLLAGSVVTGVKASLPNQFFYTAGTDFGVSKHVTLAVDLLGQRLFDASRVAPASLARGGNQLGVLNFENATVGLNNFAAGVKVNLAGELLLTANVLVRLDRGGLRQNFTPLVGLSYSF